jgi:hypothetical protein
VSVAPEAFDSERHRNLTRGEWRRLGIPGDHVNPVDGSPIPGPPRMDSEEAAEAIRFASAEHAKWREVDLDERRARVTTAVDALTERRDLLALLLVWEIRKPWRLACADVDRRLDGVRWYVGEIERQLEGRQPLDGPDSNIASWNYPMSVQVHAELVQLLAGNAVVAKMPEPGRLPHPHPSIGQRQRRLGRQVNNREGVQRVAVHSDNRLLVQRRGSRIAGKNDPLRSFAIRSCTSPACVDSSRSREPLRSVTRLSERSYRSAPIRSAASISISSCST